MKPPKIRVPVSLDEDQYDRIQEAARNLGMTLATYIRMAALKEVGNGDP